VAQQVLTIDGRYLLVEQDDQNAVVYDLHRPPAERAVWDRWSYEAARHEQPPPAPPTPDAPSHPPSPAPPRPEGRRVYQVTSSGDVINRIYSYWSNAFIQDSIGAAFVFVGTRSGPRFFKVDLGTGRVEPLGQLVRYGGETEGWYWDARGKVMIIDGPRLRRVNPFDSGDDEVLFDISSIRPGCDLWQPHSSDNGRVHSATVRQITSGAYPKIGTVVAEDGMMQVFDAEGDLDESHIDASGRFLITEESHNNRIIDLETHATHRISNAEGALAHIDCGHGFMVGENDQRGACEWMNLAHPGERRVLFQTWGMGHVSVRGHRVLLSTDALINLINLGGGIEPLVEHHMVGSGYDYQVRANLDPTGRIACYVSNNGGGGFDAFLLLI